MCIIVFPFRSRPSVSQCQTLTGWTYTPKKNNVDIPHRQFTAATTTHRICPPTSWRTSSMHLRTFGPKTAKCKSCHWSLLQKTSWPRIAGTWPTLGLMSRSITRQTRGMTSVTMCTDVLSSFFCLRSRTARWRFCFLSVAGRTRRISRSLRAPRKVGLHSLNRPHVWFWIWDSTVCVMFYRTGYGVRCWSWLFIGLDIDWEYPKGEFARTYSKEERGSFYIQMTPRPRT